MMNIREFLELVGRDKIISRFGFRPQDVSRAVKGGLFPSGWYPFIRDLCVENQIDTPDHLFRWSRVPKKCLPDHLADNPAPKLKEAS